MKTEGIYLWSSFGFPWLEIFNSVDTRTDHDCREAYESMDRSVRGEFLDIINRLAARYGSTADVWRQMKCDKVCADKKLSDNHREVLLLAIEHAVRKSKL